MHSVKTHAEGCVLTVGNFDGVHLGHRALIERLVERAASKGCPAVVFTFDPPPLKILQPDRVRPPLTWNARRESLLKSIGVDRVEFYPTTRELLSLSAEEFFRSVLIERFGVKGMVEGPNFRFGRDRLGDVETLQTLCDEASVGLDVLVPQSLGGTMVSSTQIRQWIQEGEIGLANRCLVEPYRLIGRVEHGAGRGRTLGFPTANLESIPVLVPQHGVYAAKVCTEGGVFGTPVALHIGPNPTFGEEATKVEAHLIGYSGDLYGQEIELQIIDRVRTVRKFESKDALLAQLSTDIATVLQLVK
ncbi:MAG: Riboflavin kinase [Planctomycetota bacterium]